MENKNYMQEAMSAFMGMTVKELEQIKRILNIIAKLQPKDEAWSIIDDIERGTMTDATEIEKRLTAIGV